MKIMKPAISQNLEPMEDFLDAIDLAKDEESDVTARYIKEIAFTDMDFSKVCFRESLFENCKFNHCIFRKTDFLDVVFKSCDFSNSDFSDGYFNRCRFDSCKGVGANLQNSSLKYLSMIGSNFAYANFANAKLKTVLIHETDLSDANFEECKLQELELDDVKLIHASFFRTPLKGVDFTNAWIDRMIVSGEELKGAIVNASQAADLARLLGLIVKQS